MCVCVDGWCLFLTVWLLTFLFPAYPKSPNGWYSLCANLAFFLLWAHFLHSQITNRVFHLWVMEHNDNLGSFDWPFSCYSDVSYPIWDWLWPSGCTGYNLLFRAWTRIPRREVWVIPCPVYCKQHLFSFCLSLSLLPGNLKGVNVHFSSFSPM